MNGFDIDGVTSIGIYPGPGDVIITGRSFEEAEETYKFLHARGIYNPVYFAPWRYSEKTRARSGMWKARMIKDLGVDTFFEDDEQQITVIWGHVTQEVNIVHVVSDLVNKDNVRHDEHGNELPSLGGI